MNKLLLNRYANMLWSLQLIIDLYGDGKKHNIWLRCCCALGLYIITQCEWFANVKTSFQCSFARTFSMSYTIFLAFVYLCRLTINECRNNVTFVIHPVIRCVKPENTFSHSLRLFAFNICFSTQRHSQFIMTVV